VLTELGDESGAAKNYEKALGLDADLTEIYVPLGILYYQAAVAGSSVDTAKLQTADTMLTKAAALDPNDAQTQYYLGLVRLAQNRDREALALLNKAKSMDPTMPEAFYNAGQANSRLNNNKEAVQDFTKAISLKDNYFDAWFGLGSAQFELNNYDAAITAYERAKRLKNDDPEVVANLGDVYRQKGDFNQAESNYNLALCSLNVKKISQPTKTSVRSQPKRTARSDSRSQSSARRTFEWPFLVSGTPRSERWKRGLPLQIVRRTWRTLVGSCTTPVRPT
jgi:tetratricopeptide (TPR) repeat protein